MTDTPDRRKNPARRKRDLGVTYLVSLDPLTNRWDVTRDGAPTGAFARDKDTAIGQAYAAASREAATTNLKVTAWVMQGGKKVKTWESPD